LLFYINLEFSIAQIIVFYVLQYLTVLSVLMFLGKSDTFRLIGFSLFLSAVAFLAISLLQSQSVSQFYFIAIVSGLVLPLFWVPCNIIYFNFTRMDNKALLSGFSLLIVPLLNAVVPFASGMVIEFSGFRTVFYASVALALIALIYANRIRDDSSLDLDYRKTLKPAKGVRTLICLEGFWQGVTGVCIPLITFTFIATGFGYGSFLSYLGLLGAFASLALCGLSDKMRNRAFFILPIAFLVSASTIISGLSHSMGAWVFVNGLISFFMAMASPFTLSVVLDRVRDVKDAMVAREVFLNLGRLSGVLAVLASYLISGSLHYPLIAAGVAFLLYPAVLKTKKLYPHHISLRSIFSKELYPLET